jgi:hypothetical protein
MEFNKRLSTEIRSEVLCTKGMILNIDLCCRMRMFQLHDDQ